MSAAERMPVERRLRNYRSQPIPDSRRTAALTALACAWAVTPKQRRRLAKKNPEAVTKW